MRTEGWTLSNVNLRPLNSLSIDSVIFWQWLPQSVAQCGGCSKITPPLTYRTRSLSYICTHELLFRSWITLSLMKLQRNFFFPDYYTSLLVRGVLLSGVADLRDHLMRNFLGSALSRLLYSSSEGVLGLMGSCYNCCPWDQDLPENILEPWIRCCLPKSVLAALYSKPIKCQMSVV